MRDLNLIAVDTETDGLEWFGAHRPFLATTSDKLGDELFDLTIDEGVSDFRIYLDEPDGWIFHNAAFDIHMMVAAGVEDLDYFLTRPIHDTATLARIVIPADEANYQFGLKHLAKLIVDSSYGDAEDEMKEAMHALGLIKKNQKNLPDGVYRKTWEEMPEVVEKYAMQDTRATYELFYALLERATPEDLRIYELEMRVLPELIRMEHHGIKLDQDRVRELFDEYSGHAQDALARLMEFVTIEGFNPDSNDHVAQTLIAAGVQLTDRTDSGQIRVDKWVLERHADHPAVAALLEYRTNAKFLSTYLGPMLDKAAVHPSIWSIGARTGRMSCSSPNMQNIPVRAGTAVRSVMVPRDGHSFVVADYSSIELRVLAFYMNSPDFWQILTEGDPFAWLGEGIYGSVDPADWPISRSNLKNGFYAMLYGAGGPKIAATIGGGMTPEEGRDLAKRIKATLGYHYAALNAKVRDQVRKHGYVRTLCKRTQYVPKNRDYTGLNYLIQGTAADIMKLGLLQAAKFADEVEARILLPIHDELLTEVPEEYSARWSWLLKAGLERALIDLELAHALPLTANVTVCEHSYAEAK